MLGFRKYEALGYVGYQLGPIALELSVGEAMLYGFGKPVVHLRDRRQHPLRANFSFRNGLGTPKVLVSVGSWLLEVG